MVGSPRFCCGNAFELALAPEIGFEFSEYAQHVQKGLSRRAASIDGLFRCLQGDAAFLQRVHDILEVFDATRQAIDPRHDYPIHVANRLQQVILNSRREWTVSTHSRFDANDWRDTGCALLCSCVPTMNKANVAASVGAEQAGQAM